MRQHDAVYLLAVLTDLPYLCASAFEIEHSKRVAVAHHDFGEGLPGLRFVVLLGVVEFGAACAGDDVDDALGLRGFYSIKI